MGLKQHGNRTIGKKEFKVSRIIVVLAVVLIPTIFFLLYFAYRDVFDFSFVPAWSGSVFLRWAAPISFIIGWLVMILMFANRLSNTIDKVDVSFRVIPSRYKIFYGITAVIVFLGIVLPFITPVICILMFASFGFQISTLRKDWDESDRTPKIAWIVMALFAVFPLLLAIAAYEDIYQLSEQIWIFYSSVPLVGTEGTLLEILYRISMSMATAITIGSLITLIKLGASDYEQAEIKAEREDLRIGWVRVVEFFLFALFIMIEFIRMAEEIPSLGVLMQVIYWIGLGIVLFITVVNLIRGRSQPDFRRHLIGYILTAILMGLNLLIFSFSTLDPNVAFQIKNWSIIISASVYILVFFFMFFFGATDDD
ncbi:MAG: hypothetical protein EU530_05895 [Promethearchaeota archaeon]|nr:MAG: hypothetical protein EU530_05895 [Candidatus Lokiarchaeota archaeon]